MKRIDRALSFWRFDGVLTWVLAVGIGLVALAIATVNILDRVVIEKAAAQNLHAEFLRAAASVSRIVGHAERDIHNVPALQEAFEDILELRPGIQRLDVFEVSPTSRTLIHSNDPAHPPQELGPDEWSEVSGGRSVARLDDSTDDRAWIITAPIKKDGQVVGALRGRFSLWKYDRLIKQEGELAKDVTLGLVSMTCLAFLVLIRVKVHRPMRQLLHAMRRTEAGDLTSQAALIGPSDLREIAGQFNRMLGRIREDIHVKEGLLGEIRTLNGSLLDRVAAATSELQRTNMMLLEAQVRAERTEKLAALGELSAVMAHELGSPLNAISGHLQLLRAGPGHPDQEQDRRLAIIRSQIDRMVEIITRILDSTRVQVRPTPVDLNGVVQEVLALITPGLPGRRITVKTDLAAPLPSVVGDPSALHGMIFNLATNAIQAMSKGGELGIRTSLVSQQGMPGQVILDGSPTLAGAAVRLVVEDTGHGIPPEHLEGIFEPFFTTRPNEGGAGLGLAICRRVVSSSGGRLAVRSRLGQGTLFTIDLPLWKTEHPGGLRHGA